MERKIKGLIFDLDGVLVFTDRFHALAWEAVAKEIGCSVGNELRDRLRGISRMESLELILRENGRTELSKEEKEKLAERKNLLYREYLDAMTPADVSAEVRETLDALRRRGYLLAVGSSSRNAEYILCRVGLSEFFDALSDGNAITRSKPDPEVFLKAAGRMKLSPALCAVVEDAPAGIQAAHACGMLALSVGDAVPAGDADIHLSRFSELLRWFD